MTIKYGRYELLECVSRGATAEVYKARCLGAAGFEKVLAIKRILPEVASDGVFVALFVDEARITANLSHSNIAQVFEFGKAEGTYFIAMEYVDGLDLAGVLARLRRTGTTPPPGLAIHVLATVCSALEYAHSRRDGQGNPRPIVHCDVNPANILISYEGVVKLVDFGVARAKSRALRVVSQESGKDRYLSPEQRAGEAVDARSDVYSVGAVLYDCLTGMPPGKEGSGPGRERSHGDGGAASITPPSRINPLVAPPLEAIIMQALETNPAQRYQRAEDLQADLEKFARATPLLNFGAKQLSRWMREHISGGTSVVVGEEEAAHGGAEGSKEGSRERAVELPAGPSGEPERGPPESRGPATSREPETQASNALEVEPSETGNYEERAPSVSWRKPYARRARRGPKRQGPAGAEPQEGVASPGDSPEGGSHQSSIFRRLPRRRFRVKGPSAAARDAGPSTKDAPEDTRTEQRPTRVHQRGHTGSAGAPPRDGSAPVALAASAPQRPREDPWQQGDSHGAEEPLDIIAGGGLLAGGATGAAPLGNDAAPTPKEPPGGQQAPLTYVRSTKSPLPEGLTDGDDEGDDSKLPPSGLVPFKTTVREDALDARGSVPGLVPSAHDNLGKPTAVPGDEGRGGVDALLASLQQEEPRSGAEEQPGDSWPAPPAPAHLLVPERSRGRRLVNWARQRHRRAWVLAGGVLGLVLALSLVGWVIFGRS